MYMYIYASIVHCACACNIFDLFDVLSLIFTKKTKKTLPKIITCTQGTLNINVIS